MSLWDHLAAGAATVARCWAIERRDGLRLAFTDHDRPLAFDGLAFRPDAGLTASALVAGLGLAVDNAEATGALSSDAISEADLDAGRYDGAAVRLWLVNWADPSERALRFAGTLGEVTRGAGAFHAELRGLSEALNRPTGRLYQPACAATFGDAACGVDAWALSAGADAGPTDGRTFRVAAPQPPGWFEHGRLVVLTGAAEGLEGTIKHDRPDGGPDGTGRVLELWSPIPAPVAPADTVRLLPGCDRRAETCRARFANMANFRGFPSIPGEDWLMAVPHRAGLNDGGSLG